MVKKQAKKKQKIQKAVTKYAKMLDTRNKVYKDSPELQPRTNLEMVQEVLNKASEIHKMQTETQTMPFEILLQMYPVEHLKKRLNLLRFKVMLMDALYRELMQQTQRRRHLKAAVTMSMMGTPGTAERMINTNSMLTSAGQLNLAGLSQMQTLSRLAKSQSNLLQQQINTKQKQLNYVKQQNQMREANLKRQEQLDKQKFNLNKLRITQPKNVSSNLEKNIKRQLEKRNAETQELTSQLKKRQEAGYQNMIGLMQKMQREQNNSERYARDKNRNLSSGYKRLANQIHSMERSKEKELKNFRSSTERILKDKAKEFQKKLLEKRAQAIPSGESMSNYDADFNE